MTWRDFLRAARDELLAAGQPTNPDLILERALAMPGGRDEFEAQADKGARRAALREASRLLRDASEAAADPETGRLFAVVMYEPPRAITYRDEHGTWHKAIEHATAAEAAGYEVVLSENAEAARARHWDFRLFLRKVGPYMGDGMTIGDALRCLADQADGKAAA